MAPATYHAPSCHGNAANNGGKDVCAVQVSYAQHHNANTSSWLHNLPQAYKKLLRTYAPDLCPQL